MNSNKGRQSAAAESAMGSVAWNLEHTIATPVGVVEKPEAQIIAIGKWMPARLPSLLQQPVLRRNYFYEQGAALESPLGESVKREHRWFEFAIPARNSRGSADRVQLSLPVVDCRHQTTSGSYHISDTLSGLKVLLVNDLKYVFSYLEGLFAGLSFFSRAGAGSFAPAQYLDPDSFPPANLVKGSFAAKQSSFLRQLIEVEPKLRLSAETLPAGIIRRGEKIAEQWSYVMYIPAPAVIVGGWQRRLDTMFTRLKKKLGIVKAEPLPLLLGRLSLRQQKDGNFQVELVSQSKRWQRDDIVGLAAAVLYLHGVLRGALIAKA